MRLKKKEEPYVPYTDEQLTHYPKECELIGLIRERFWGAILENRLSEKTPYRLAIQGAEGKPLLVCVNAWGVALDEVEPVPLGVMTEQELEFFGEMVYEAEKEEIERRILFEIEEEEAKKRSRVFLILLTALFALLAIKYFYGI